MTTTTDYNPIAPHTVSWGWVVLPIVIIVVAIAVAWLLWRHRKDQFRKI